MCSKTSNLFQRRRKRSNWFLAQVVDCAEAFSVPKGAIHQVVLLSLLYVLSLSAMERFLGIDQLFFTQIWLWSHCAELEGAATTQGDISVANAASKGVKGSSTLCQMLVPKDSPQENLQQKIEDKMKPSLCPHCAAAVERKHYGIKKGHGSSGGVVAFLAQKPLFYQLIKLPYSSWDKISQHKVDTGH